VIALDRMERGQSELSAVQEVRRNYDIPVISIATLDDLLGYLRAEGGMTRNFASVQAYRDRYGVKDD
jgi:orotate phosphoribosyltransferase